LVLEDGSEIADELWDAAHLGVSTRLVYPEARAALARAARDQRIDEDALRTAAAELDRFCAELRLIGIDARLAREAGDLAELHALTGYDAVHLASALSLRDEEVVVATWDRELGAASAAAGCIVVPAV